MKSINPYLNFPGNTEEAFNFYKKNFGGDFLGGIFRFDGTPGSENLSAEDKQKIMHIALPIGPNNMIMATDALESMGFKVTTGNSIHLQIYAESKEEADKLFNGLAECGQIDMPIGDQFWGDYFGSLTDKFGVKWMIVFTNPKQ
ncbi:MAG: VOC family protein [Ignavibacteriota bacterium]